MIYAVLSDVHGNLPALEAVLQDAASRGAEHFLLLGDYCLSNPWPDECLRRIFALENATVIRGNEENYLENLQGKDQTNWTDGQMQISYWTYRHVSDANRQKLLSLPWQQELRCHGVKLHLAHDSSVFLGGREGSCIGPARTALCYRQRPAARRSFQQEAEKALNADPAFLAALNNLEDGIYLFGHTHTQWQLTSPDGKKLLMNPGSCGLPLDGVRNTVPYGLIEIRPDGTWNAQSLRIPFDMKAAARAVEESTQFTEANVWSRIIQRELTTALEHVTFFLRFAEEYAQSIGDPRRPYGVDTWEAAYRAWEHPVLREALPHTPAGT